MSRRHLAAWAWAWTVLILLACWAPRRYLPVEESRRRPLAIVPLDKAVHFGLFFGFGVLWMGAGARRDRVLIGGVALAVMSELGQELPIVSRDASALDALADILGVAAGAMAAAGFLRRGSAAKDADEGPS